MKFSDNILNESLSELRVTYPNMGDNDKQFVYRIFSDGIDKYSDRLKAIDFSNGSKVLDAGCGFGQWSLALSFINKSVYSCDISPLRIELLRIISKKLFIKNLESVVSELHCLPYEDCFFDKIFCYGVIFLTPWRKSLAEFKRILKPGGKLYVNANSLAWYMFLWNEEYNKATDYDPKQVAASSLADTLTYDRENIYYPGMNLIIDPDSLELSLKDLGFIDVILAPEGNIHLNKDYAKPIPFFRRQFYGNLGVYEAIATKNSLNVSDLIQ